MNPFIKRRIIRTTVSFGLILLLFLPVIARKKWKSQPEKAAMLTVQAHPDDEGFRFGGALSYYGVVRNMAVVSICLTSGETWGEGVNGDPAVREKELECAWQTYGLDHPPIMSRFKAGPVNEINRRIGPVWVEGEKWIQNTWRRWGGREKVIGYLTRKIRKYRPEIVLGQDLVRGSYGHPEHLAAAIALMEAVDAAADASRFPEQLVTLKVWQVKKSYFHFNNQKILKKRLVRCQS